ncbi:MAG: single-stranded DNA-binding protein [Clostridia bacterium]|nr:single-stranded DNA-binding protein [Clostridia bacterium]
MKVFILGNLSTDVTTKQTNGGNIATFTVKERKSRKDEAKPNNFWNVTVFGQKAEFAAKYFKNGSPVFVTGKADWSEFTAQDGSPKRNVAISADDVDFVPKDFSAQNAAQTQNAAPAPAASPAPAPAQEESDPNDLPF